MYVDKFGDRFSSINININYVDVSVCLCCQYIYVGCFVGYIFSLNGCYFFWGNSDFFFLDVVIGIYNQYCFFVYMWYVI